MKIDNKIIVSNINGDYYASILDKKFKCCIGENGVTSNKLEGDGKTPIGNYPLREIWVREDKLSWGLGIGDWGLGIGAQSPIPNPQSPIPNPQSPKDEKINV
jgi:hypothetical protein